MAKHTSFFTDVSHFFKGYKKEIYELREQWLTNREVAEKLGFELKQVKEMPELKEALTEEINDREVYMKGIDASYNYEGYNSYKSEDLK